MAFILATVANGDGGEYAYYLRRADGQWKQITRFEDQVKQIEFGRDPLYVELRETTRFTCFAQGRAARKNSPSSAR